MEGSNETDKCGELGMGATAAEPQNGYNDNNALL